jgi:hypothetical protein
MSSSKKANGLAVPLSLFVVVAAVGNAAAAVVDGKRGSCIHTTKLTFLPTCAIIEKPYSFGVTAMSSAQQHGRSVCFSPGFALIHMAHGPPESA